DYMDTLLDRFRDPLARDLMRRCEKQDIDALGLQRLPTKRLQRIAAIAADLRINLVEPGCSAAFAITGKQERFFSVRMACEQAHQFKTGIAGCAYNRGLDLLSHYARMSSRRICSLRAILLSGVMMSTVSSPATVPTTSSQPSASIASPTGWALPEVVLMTSKFWARRTSRTNSRTMRVTLGAGSVRASPLGSV